jgi:chemotaxis-related protein WspB
MAGLFLQFQLGRDRYALDARQVAKVLPLLSLKQIPAAPAWVAGVFVFQSMPVPVIDLNQLALGCPASRRLGTRIVLVHYPQAGADSHLLGIIVEQATRTLRREPSDFTECGIANDAAPYLGPVAEDANGLVQSIRVQDLLPAAVQALLFQEALET